MSLALSVRQFEGKEGYAEIRDNWSELMRSVTDQYFYHHPTWSYAYFGRPAPEDEIYFRCVFHGSRLIAVCRLVFDSRYGNILREGALPSHDILYMPDIAVSDSADLSAVWETLSAPGDKGGSVAGTISMPGPCLRLQRSLAACVLRPGMSSLNRR